MAATYVFAALAALGAICTLCLVRHKMAERLPLPPGPRRLPVIGNLRDLPFKDETATYNKWAKEHGL